MVGLGDSTTAGTPGFLSPLESPPEGKGDQTSQYAYWIRQEHSDWEVLNRGIDGQRSDEIRERFDRDVLGCKTDAVVIIAGVNDIYQGYSTDHVKKHLLAMYTRAAEHGLPVIAGSVLPYNTSSDEQRQKIEEVNHWIEETAARTENLNFCDTNKAVRDPDDPHKLMGSPDGLHPDVGGYKQMAEALCQVLRDVFQAEA